MVRVIKIAIPLVPAGSWDTFHAMHAPAFPCLAFPSLSFLSFSSTANASALYQISHVMGFF